MGYTHYWERPRILPRLQFIAAVQDCRRLCTGLNIPLGGADGRGEPIFSDDKICFNGHVDSGRLTSAQKAEGLIWPGRDAHGVAVIGEGDAVVGHWSAGPAVSARVLGGDGNGSYEAFFVPRIAASRMHNDEQSENQRCGEFCKTNYRPYDLCVQGCLIALSHHLGSTSLRVASDGTSQGWNDARDAAQHILGYGIDWGEDKLAPVPPTPQAPK
jgi:hypothetical protein